MVSFHVLYIHYTVFKHSFVFESRFSVPEERALCSRIKSFSVTSDILANIITSCYYSKPALHSCPQQPLWKEAYAELLPAETGNRKQSLTSCGRERKRKPPRHDIIWSIQSHTAGRVQTMVEVWSRPPGMYTTRDTSIIANIWPQLSPAKISAGLFAHLTSIQFY